MESRVGMSFVQLFYFSYENSSNCEKSGLLAASYWRESSRAAGESLALQEHNFTNAPGSFGPLTTRKALTGWTPRSG